MSIFSERSVTKLRTCDPLIVKLFLDVVSDFDCTILCGHRSQLEQDEAYHRGLSQLTFPNSKHNVNPSKAVDVVPYFSQKPHIRWDDLQSFCFFAGAVLGIASQKGIHIRWGGNFNMSDDIHSNKFVDMPHFELLERK